MHNDLPFQPLRPSLFIGGSWTGSSDNATRESVNPADGHVVALVDEATEEAAARAVAAAREAFDRGPWPRSAPEERAALLEAIAALLDRDREAIARLETLDTGKTLKESRIDIDDVAAVFRYYARLAEDPASYGRDVDIDEQGVVSRVTHEPIGVCVMIAPWNYPLLQISWKIAPALAAGCAMVLKPSEVTPLSTIALVRLIEEAGVPAGVVNLVLGSGATVGAALVDTPDVDLVSFTGGLQTGTVIAATAAKHVTKAALELGGKNPHIVFADADWDSAVDAVLTGVFLHSGQVCSAGTRLIVEEPVADRLVAELAARAERIKVGDGLDPTSETGPLVSFAHREKVERYVAVGIAEGAKLVCGGRRPEDPPLADGAYYPPTIFDHCDRRMRIVREETFGPILTVERFTTEEEAVRLGNDTRYGLAAGVRTADDECGERVARALRHGTVWINDFGRYAPAAEWGGFGDSGFGRELGPGGLAEYQQSKHVWRNTEPKAGNWFADDRKG